MHEVDRWVNSYTAIVNDSTLENGDEVYIPTQDIEINSFMDKLRVAIGEITTPRDEHYNVHLSKDKLRARVVDVGEEQQVVEVYGDITYHNSRHLKVPT